MRVARTDQPAKSVKGLCRGPNRQDVIGDQMAKVELRDCMKSPQARAIRLVMRRIMAAYTNDSPLAHSLS